MEPTSLKYRPDIDGLRALAVLPVVWSHSDLPGLPGGFTGVDTFFVISGYLITRIIYGEMSSGSFSFSTFYKRRIRRIAPALLVVLAVTFAAAFLLLLPYELEQFAKTAAAAIAMVSNIFFWRTGNYFALAESITPLLHTWSLGVEEQFYLLFPATLFVAYRFRAPRRTIAAIGIASLLLCLLATPRSPAASFYLLPPRSWELMFGAALAVKLVVVPARAKGAAGVIGLTLLAAAALLISPDDPFPGWRALVPATGAALLIGSGPDSMIGRALAYPALRFVGKISYSLYLWHWPVFVFLRHWRAGTQLPASLALVGIGLSLVLSAVTYRWIEQPARSRSTSFKRVAGVCLALGIGVVASTAAALASGGLPSRLPSRVDWIAARHSAFAPLAHSCTDVGFATALANCRVGPRGPTELVLWGDSHAAAVSEGVAAGFQRPGVILSMGSCAPAEGWLSSALKGRDGAMCQSFKRQTVDYIERDRNISTVVLSAYWTVYGRAGGIDFWRGVQKVVDELRSRGKTVIVITGIPAPGVDVPWTDAIRARFGRPPLRLDCAGDKLPLQGVKQIDVAAGFCSYPPELLFTDSNHVSRFAGLKIIAPAITAALAS